MAAGITTLTASTFDEEISGSAEPVLVDFWAEWCGPCKMIAPILDEIADEQAGNIKIAKLNVDEAAEVARRLKCSASPPSWYSRTAKLPSASWAPRARPHYSTTSTSSCRPPLAHVGNPPQANVRATQYPGSV